MGRAPCCDKVGMKKGRWTAEEDDKLSKYIQAHGEGSWRSLPKNAGLVRCGKSCRLRWINYLRADLKRGNISPEEEDVIIKLHSTLGNKWSLIAGHLPGRTDNEIKNYWNSHLSRKIYTFRRPVMKETIGFVPTKPKGGKTSRWAMKKNRIVNPTKNGSIITAPAPEETVPLPEKETMCLDHHLPHAEDKEGDLGNLVPSSPYPQEGIILDRTSGNLMLCPTNGYENETQGPSSCIDDFAMLLHCNNIMDNPPLDPDPNVELPVPTESSSKMATSNGDSNSINNQWFSYSPVASCLDLDDQVWRDIADDSNLMSFWLEEGCHDHVEVGQMETYHEKQNEMVAWLFS